MDAIRFNTKINIETNYCRQHTKLEKLIEQHFGDSTSLILVMEDFDLDIDVNQDSPQKKMMMHHRKVTKLPIVKYINKILIDAIRMGASDLHLNPMKNVSGSLSC